MPIAFILSLFVRFTIPTHPIKADALCFALEQRENGKWNNHGGKACWTIDTWYQFTDLPYGLACNPDCSRAVMRRLIQNYSTRLALMGKTPTVWRIAMAYRYGFDGALRKTREPNDYGELTEGIYESVQTTQKEESHGNDILYSVPGYNLR